MAGINSHVNGIDGHLLRKPRIEASTIPVIGDPKIPTPPGPRVHPGPKLGMFRHALDMPWRGPASFNFRAGSLSNGSFLGFTTWGQLWDSSTRAPASLVPFMSRCWMIGDIRTRSLATTPGQLGKFLEVTHPTQILPQSELCKSSWSIIPIIKNANQQSTICFNHLPPHTTTRLRGSSSEMHPPDPEPPTPRVGVACWNVGLPPPGSSCGQWPARDVSRGFRDAPEDPDFAGENMRKSTAGPCKKWSTEHVESLRRKAHPHVLLEILEKSETEYQLLNLGSKRKAKPVWLLLVYLKNVSLPQEFWGDILAMFSGQMLGANQPQRPAVPCSDSWSPP